MKPFNGRLQLIVIAGLTVLSILVAAALRKEDHDQSARREAIKAIQEYQYRMEAKLDSLLNVH